MADHDTHDHTGVPGVGSSTTTVATDTIWDAAGDLVQGTGANTAAKLSAGSAGKVLTSNGAAAALTWETPSGGSGGGTPSVIRYAPENTPPTVAVGHEYLDGTHGGFSWNSNPATNDVTYLGRLRVAATDTAERWYSKAWTPGATDLTVTTKFMVQDAVANISTGFGIYVANSTGATPTDCVLLQLLNTSGSWGLASFNRNTGSFSQVGSTLTLRAPSNINDAIYIRMTRVVSGPTWHFYWSGDGIVWSELATTGSKSLTVGAIGIRLDSTSTGLTTATMDYIRGWASLVEKIGS